MEIYAVKLEQSGRILIPAVLRKRFGLIPGQDVLISVDDRSIRLKGTRATAVQEVQKILSAYAPGRVLSEEVIAERRAEAER